MVNVATRPTFSSRMHATITLESTPPLRKTPSGTSASSRARTASRTACRTRARSSSAGTAVADAGVPAGSVQYRRSVSTPPSSVATCAGGSFAMPSKIERPAGV